MYKKGYRVGIVFFILACVCLVACDSNSSRRDNDQDEENTSRNHILRVEADSVEYIGRIVDSVAGELRTAGFDSIKLDEIDDLASKGDTPDGVVESVSINGAPFSKGDSFDKESEVEITYHSYRKIHFPLSKDECNVVPLDDLEEVFCNAGFTDYSMSEITDLDPDLYDQQTVVFIDGVEVSQSVDDEFPFDATINIVRHYTYNKYNLDLTIDFPGNIFFDKYDVNVYVDGDLVTNLPHGNGWSGTIRSIEGNHSMIFTKTDDMSVKGEIPYILSEDTDANFSIKTYSNMVEPKVIFYQPKLKEDTIRMAYGESSLKNKDYNDVVKELKTLGFTNIKLSVLYDIYWGITDSGETESVSIAGRRDYGKGDVFNKDDEVIVTYHMPVSENPNKPTPTPTPAPTPTLTPKPTTTPAPTPKTMDMPVMKGSSLKSAMDVAAKYGVKELFEDDFGHGTKCKSMSDSSGGLMLTIIYSTGTNEILCGNITTNKLATDKQQQDFIKAMASVLCPSVDSGEVSTWVSSNVGSKSNTVIGGFTYEVSLGPVQNALYYAGYSEWESWELQY